MENKPEKPRTQQQNKALHVYFQLVAEKLNEAGLDMRVVLEPEIDIPWTSETIKNYLWRPIQKIQLQKDSTTELTTKEIDIVYETMNRHIAKFGITEPFPSIQEIINQQTIFKNNKK